MAYRFNIVAKSFLVLVGSVVITGANADLKQIEISNEAIYRCETQNLQNPKWQERITIKWDMNSTTNAKRHFWSGPSDGTMRPNQYLFDYTRGEVLIDRISYHNSSEAFLFGYAPEHISGFYGDNIGALTSFHISLRGIYTSHKSDLGLDQVVIMTGQCVLIKGKK